MFKIFNRTFKMVNYVNNSIKSMNRKNFKVLDLNLLKNSYHWKILQNNDKPEIYD